MNSTEIIQTKYKSQLIKLGNHGILAIVALIGIGSATRVMEAGLACPDWPLCYGSFLPLTHMNLRVFLEWFHRLDAFLVGILISIQFLISLIRRKFLPTWLPKVYSFLVFLVILQGSLGALTVINVLDSFTVMGHLLIAFILLITAISINQKLKNNYNQIAQKFWKIILIIPLVLTLIQSIIGVRLSSTWSAHLCLTINEQCFILDWHKLFAIPVFISVLSIIVFSISKDNLFINNWKFLIPIFFILNSQIFLGFLSIKTNLSQPFIIVIHQLLASLLVAMLSTLLFRNYNPNLESNPPKSNVEFQF